MAASLNKVFLIGRLGADPKLRYTASGQAVADFNIATDEGYSKDGQRQERTEWHRIVAWSKDAEFAANYLSKGRLVFVEGRIQTRSWEDQQGQTKYITEVVASRVQGLDSRRPGEGAGEGAGDERPMPAQAQGQAQGGGARKPAPRPQQQPRQQGGDEDLGPAFPSEASGMDDVPF